MTSNVNPNGNPDAFTRLRKRLATLRRQLRWFYFCNGLNWMIAVGSGAAILLGVFAVLLQAPSSILLTLAAVTGVVLLAVFIRFWVNTTPALPEPAAKAAKAKSAERYEAFITALGRRLAQGPKLRQEVSEDVTDQRVEFGRLSR